MLKQYINGLRLSAIRGERIVINNIASIFVLKDENKAPYTKYLPDRVRDISYKLGITLKDVDEILKLYLYYLVDEAKNGRDINVNGIMTVRVEDRDGYIQTRGKVSNLLKSMLDNLGEGDYKLGGSVSVTLQKHLH